MDNRQRIIEEAAVMFRTYGIRTVTMDMLANQLGISKRTIYEIFKEKDEIIEAVLKWMTVRQRELMEKVLKESGNVIEAIFKILDLMMEHFQKMSPAFQMDMKRLHNDVMNKMEGAKDIPYIRNNSLLIERGISEGVFRDDIDVQIINKCMLEVVKMTNDRELFPPDSFPNEDVIRNVYINYLRGISTSKGLELIDYYENRSNKNIRNK
jgi:TetR/AcrR family transcriptional regulator, cholesterol catabolism regulator